MRLTFFRWRESKKLGIDNDKLTLEEVQAKLIEEVSELVEALSVVNSKANIPNLLHFLEEFWDVIQILILLLFKVKYHYRVLTGATEDEFKGLVTTSYYEHESKRIDREWQIGREIIEVHIDE